MHQPTHRVRFRRELAFVRGAFTVAERTAVALVVVKPVVKALRNLVEAVVGFDDEPVHVDAGVGLVGKQAGQQLGDAAAGRRRVHVPDRTAGEPAADAVERVVQPANALIVQDGAERAPRSWNKRDFLHVLIRFLSARP